MKPHVLVSVLLLAFAAIAPAQGVLPSLNSSPWLGQELLGRISDRSVTVNVAFDTAMQVYVEYGTAPGSYASKTAVQATTAGTPLNVVLDNLTPNTRYYYRLQYAPSGSSTFTPRPEHFFMTQRPRGSIFTFILHADPHLDSNSNTDVYKLTLANELAEKPDFLIDLGDTMLTDKLNAQGSPDAGGSQPTTAAVLYRTQLLRSYYDLANHSVPLFLTLGNHEGEWGAGLTGTPNNFAIWDTQDRTAYFPNPAPDSFFSGDTQSYDLNGNLCASGATCGLGQRRSYYSWEWGDALFIVLDPFWNQPAATQTGTGQNCCKGKTDWSLTLGTVQYNWLKQTLEKSSAKYKFVFSHNLVGGVNPVAKGVAQGPMRGGVEAAKYLEWGGYNLDGTWGFATYRPEMPLPIHQLLVANRVTAWFHGHDHLYAHQSLDGIAYQEVPQPSANNATLGTRASDYGYIQGTLLGGRGYLRVQVAPTGVTVQYIETWLPSEEKGSTVNRMVADSYSLSPAAAIQAPAIASVATSGSGSAAIAPNTWVEIKGVGLAVPGNIRSWSASDFAANGNQMPKQLDSVSVTVNGKPAYVAYISPAQINILTPPDAISGSVPVHVTVNGLTSAAFSVPAQASSPAFFTFGGGYVAATHANGTYLGPTTLYPGVTTPAKPGETVVLYGNGFGATATPVTAGSPLQSGTLPTMPVIKIGGVSADVKFAGLVFSGEFQFNVVVPANTPDGDQPINATYNGYSTQAGALLTVQR